jgi:hypothetical protein
MTHTEEQSGPGTGGEDFVDLWRLETSAARALAAEAERFEDLQTVLRCCEGLLPELGRAAAGFPEAGLLVEGLWTVALTSYARCFDAAGEGTPLTEEDVVTAHPDNPEVREWHRALMRLRKHYASASVNPRESVSVSVARAEDGSPAGIALTSAARPALDEVTVRSAGTIAFALSEVVDGRIAGRQGEVFTEVAALDSATLDGLAKWRAARPPEA